MDPCDLIVRGGLVVTPEVTEVTDVAITGEVISGIGRGPWRALRTIDAEGLLVLPGGVDPHTHLNSQWPSTSRPPPAERLPADNFGSGTKAAVAGGITTVCDFVYALDGETLSQAIERVEGAAAGSSHADFAFHVVVATLNDGLIEEVPSLIEAGYPSFKFYTQFEDFATRGKDYLRLLETIGAHDGVAMFHCEDRDILEYCGANLRSSGKVSPRHYASAKPVEAETAATALALAYAASARVAAYIVHLSAGPPLDQVTAARARGQRVYAETRPLYLHLTSSCYDKDEPEAALFVGTPPLRTDVDRDRLWTGLGADEVDTVGSDHVGFTRAQKYWPGDTFETVPRGVSNLETMIPMLYSEGVLRGRLTLERLVQVVSENPARIFGLYPQKGAIAVGSDADLCILDPLTSRTISGAALHSAADFDPFDGWEVTGWPALTLLRGQVVFDRGEVVAAPGSGRLVKGSASRHRVQSRRDD